MIGLFKQEFKSLFKSPAALSILIIPIVLLIGIGFLLPSAWIIPSSITIGIVATVLLYFGGSIEEIKRTSFMKSISLTKLSKATYLSTKILFSVLISIFIILWVLFFGWAFTSLGFLADDFSVIIPEDSGTAMNVVRNIKFDVHWDQINWLVMFYAGAITIIVSTSLAFLFVTFSNSSLSFYLMSFGYLLAMILFGGIIMPSFLISSDNSGFKILYYLIPNYYTNNEMASSFGSTMGATVHGLTDKIDSLSRFLNILGIDLSLIDNINGATSDLVAAWISGDKLGGYDFGELKWDFNTQEGINLFFDQLKNGGFDWKNIFVKHHVEYSTNPEYFDLVEKVMNNNLRLHNLSSAILVNILDGNLLIPEEYRDAITNFINDNLPKYADLILGALKIAKWNIPLTLHLKDNKFDVFYIISNFLNGDGGLVYILDTIDSMVNDMFAIPFDLTTWKGTLDLVMPWIETTLFLGISIRFFKWS